MFRIRDAQRGALAQAYAVDAASAALAAKGFITKRGAAPGELLAYDRRGKCSRFLFGTSARLAQLTSPLGRTHRFAYDEQGRLTALAEPNGLVTTVAYETNGRPASVTRGEQQRWSFDWDAQGNPTRLTLPDGAVWASELTPNGQLLTSARATSIPVSVERDENGFPTALVEPAGARTQFEYGIWDRPVRTLRANGEVEEVSRNGAGQLVGATQNGEAWFDAEHNAEGRVSAIRYADGHFVEFAYNVAGQVVTAKNPNSTVERRYDDDGRLICEVQNDQTVTYAYGVSGLLVGLKTPKGETIEFSYDDDARLSGILDWNKQAHTISYARDEQSVFHQFPNGVTGCQQLLQTGLPSSISVSRPRVGDAPLGLAYAYTPVDRIQVCDDSEIGARSFAYDSAGQLLQVRSRTPEYDENYAYDANGNRHFANGISFESNVVNQTTACGPLRYAYDARGNLVSEAGPLGATTYRYDGQNQLVEVVAPEKPIVRYEYDAFGRRILKRVGASVTRYVWAGDQLLSESTESEGQRVERDYLFLPGSNTPVSMRVDGATFQYHTDHNGTPRWLTDARAEVVWSGVIHRFGHVEELISNTRQPLRFPGQYFDEETGLHYNRARYYSPQLGRYLSRDPLSFITGFNFYTYAGNDPINETDPLGLFSWGAAALAVGGIIAGAALIAVCLPAIAVTVAGMAAVAGVVAGAALVGGCVAMLATDVATDGCMPCMKAAFEKGVIEGAKIGFDVALLVLTAGAAGPGLALAEGGVVGALSITRGITSAAIAAAAAAGIVSMSGGGSGSGGGGGDDDKEARRKADAERKVQRKRERELNDRAKSGDKDATIEQNKIRAQEQRDAGNKGSAEGYEAENRVIEGEGDNVVEAGREVEYPDPRNPGKTINSDIDMETKTNVTQIKSGTDMPKQSQVDCTRLRAAETGKQPELIYDPAKMPPESVEEFKNANPDFILTPKNLH